MNEAQQLFNLRVDNGTQEAAKSLYLNGHPKEAIRLLSGHLKTHPDDGRSWEMLGTMYHATGQIASAVSALEHATTLVPLTLVGQYSLADCYLDIGMTHTASDMFEHLMYQKLPTELVPPVVAALSKVGLNFHALELSREAASRNPSCDEAWFSIAHHMALCGYPPCLVVPVLNQAVELEPRNPVYRCTLAKFAIEAEESGIAYRAIANLEPASIQQLACTFCILHFEHLYKTAGDDVRAKACRDRMNEIIENEKDAS